MEFINKIELQGMVGNVWPMVVGNTKGARFSLATENTYTRSDGETVVDITWFSITAFEGDKITCISNLQKGAKVHLTGHVKCVKYAGSDGNNHQYWEVIASELEIIEE